MSRGGSAGKEQTQFGGNWAVNLKKQKKGIT